MVLEAVTVVTVLGCGLVAGLLFAFSVCVMGALGRMPPAQGIVAMQTINVVIQNPVFGLVFVVASAGSAYLAGSAAFTWGDPGTVARLAGGSLFLVGVLGVTMSRNVPLNERLAAVDAASTAGSDVWRHYLATWTRWNHLRTAVGVLATASLSVSLLARG